jgi:hypothetical protein
LFDSIQLQSNEKKIYGLGLAMNRYVRHAVNGV